MYLDFITLLLSVAAQVAVSTPTPSALPPPPQVVVKPAVVRPLPGGLDKTPMFNSNSPEVVQTPGVLLSTFPCPDGEKASVNLNYPLQGRFDVFAHHIANAVKTPDNLRTLYLAIVIKNVGKKPATVKVLQAASYLSQPDAPFIELPAYVDNPDGLVYAGPGDRVTDDVLRGWTQDGWPQTIAVEPGASALLANLPIPVRGLTPPINGRTLFARLQSDQPVCLASLAMFARDTDAGTERPPELAEWMELLDKKALAGPREAPASIPGASGPFAYGRVAGVAIGSRWEAKLVDDRNRWLELPLPDKPVSYVLSTVDRGTFGTGQVQAAPLAVRYPDSAYRAHGNYLVEYSLKLPLHNGTDKARKAAIIFQTPIKTEKTEQGLSFYAKPSASTFFRGTLKLKYFDDDGVEQQRYVHLVEKRGDEGSPLLLLELKPRETRDVNVDFLYPPDSTPPQVLTISTQE